MSDAYVIEVHGKTVGLIVRRHGGRPGYHFLASLPEFNSLEGEAFSGPYGAERAARSLARCEPILPANRNKGILQRAARLNAKRTKTP